MPRDPQTETAKSHAMQEVPNPKRRGKPSKPWEPTPRDWAWWHSRCVEHLTYVAIAKKAKVSRERVFEIVAKVREWMQARLHDDIVAFRIEQTEALDAVAAEAWQAWKRSTKGGAIGDAGFLREFRAALADIRSIWGVDKPKKIEASIDSRSDGLIRVEGLSRPEAIRAQAQHLSQIAEALETSSNQSYLSSVGEAE